jgi:hypothetical protein
MKSQPAREFGTYDPLVKFDSSPHLAILVSGSLDLSVNNFALLDTSKSQPELVEG